MRKVSGENETGLQIKVKVIPRAKTSEISGVMDDGSLKVRLAAPPVDGKANRALIKLLAKTLRVPASHISIISGERGRIKRIFIEGLDRQKYQAIIDPLIN